MCAQSVKERVGFLQYVCVNNYINSLGMHCCDFLSLRETFEKIVVKWRSNKSSASQLKICRECNSSGTGFVHKHLDCHRD